MNNFNQLRELKETIYKNTAAIKKIHKECQEQGHALKYDKLQKYTNSSKTIKLPNLNLGDIDDLNSSTTIKLVVPKKKTSFQARWFH